MVADTIKKSPDLYNDAILEKSNSDYCKWIMKDSSWGGAIETSILSESLEVEIVCVEVKTKLMNR